MRLLILLATIVVIAAFAEEEESEPSLCVEHQNPFDYTHCIKKRDVGCQNGEFCGTCNTNSCQTCNGNSCRTSCNGPACNQCPSGNCCDGQNCNVCSGRNCCSGSNCNNCVNSCNGGCTTPACRSSCFQTCQSSSCCDRSECFNTCRNQCFGDHCYENCFKQQCPCPQNCEIPVPNPGTGSLPIIAPPPIVYPNISFPAQNSPERVNHTVVVVNKPENHNPVNITTIVNLKNYINNKNIINTPINITNVNHNHINESRAPEIDKGPVVDSKCCIVVYPVHCYDIVEPPYKKCIQKRERKCGDICTSVVVHVVHVPGKDREVPVPYPVQVQVPGPVQVVRQPLPYPVPVMQRYPVYVPTGTAPGTGTSMTPCGASGGCGYRPICHYINRYPWISCSHYGTQNCGSCYMCGGQYNPTFCRQQISCAPLCRGGIVNFGNTFQNDIMRFAQSYPGQYSAQIPQPRPIEVAQPSPQQAYVQQPADLSQQILQQPVDYQGALQQQYVVQQPLQQQYVAVQQPYDQQSIQQVVHQPYDQQSIQQVVHQPYDQQSIQQVVHQPYDQQGIQQVVQQPVQLPQQQAAVVG